MAFGRLARDEAWYEVTSLEEQLFNAIAVFSLAEEGISSPSKAEINEKISYLFHLIIKPSVLISRRLTHTELKCLYHASCGKEVKEIAILLKKTESSIIKIRASACHKLRCGNTCQAIFVATQLGYLPLKNNQMLSQPIIKLEEEEYV